MKISNPMEASIRTALVGKQAPANLQYAIAPSRPPAKIALRNAPATNYRAGIPGAEKQTVISNAYNTALNDYKNGRK